jgi:GntR family transcriptional regulator/MocR family aminotransferase
MRLGWLVVPAALRVPLLEAMAELGAAVPAVQQLAMADLIGRGGYDRHIRRMRLVYRRRRAELAGRLAIPLEGAAAGLHALILGYATPPPHAWSRALEALAEVVQGI